MPVKNIRRMLAVAAAVASLQARGETNVVAVAQDPEVVAALRAENEALRRENQQLRRELVRRQGGEPVIDMSRKADAPALSEDPGRITDDGGYWLVPKSMKRHNSKCRYYKMGKGRPCKKDEGEPCKKCGG